VTTPNDDLERRLREHYRSQPAPLPDEAVDGARARVGRPHARRMPLFLAAASLGAILLATVAMASTLLSSSEPGPTVRPSRPVDSASAPATQAPSPAPARYEAGQLLRATASFPLSGDWSVETGQSMYVVARERGASGDIYTIQHWGDLETGLKPDTVIGTVGTAILYERTEPYEPACPATVSLVEQVAALQPFERLVCFGARELDFGPVRRQEYAVMQGSPPWLAGEAGLDFFTALPFEAADGTQVPAEGWLRVTGHFDDPGCAADLPCRERFVVTATEPAAPPTSELQGTWTPMAEAPIAGRSSYVALGIDHGTFIWGGDGSGQGRSGAIYDAGADRWTEIRSAPGVDRIGVAAVWSGDQVLIWGGNDALRDGLAYDPDSDRWSSIPDAPITGSSGVGAWTGSEFVVVSTRAQAAAWDPAAGTWRRLPDPPLPVGYLESVWTGGELIVLGLMEGAADPIVGAVFDPTSSTWRAIASPPYDGLALGIPPRWTEAGMVFVEHAYDPATDGWSQLKIDGCTRGAVSYGVWTGRWLLSQTQAYDPAAGRCLTLPNAPIRPGFENAGFEVRTHEFHTPIWADGRLMVWSGGTGLDGPGSPPDGVVFAPNKP
jgi:hypothetical protein